MTRTQFQCHVHLLRDLQNPILDMPGELILTHSISNLGPRSKLNFDTVFYVDLGLCCSRNVAENTKLTALVLGYITATCFMCCRPLDNYKIFFVLPEPGS